MSLAAAAFAALAVLSKGLIGLALPGMILALWLASRRDYRGFLALVWPPAIAVFALIALPWFVLMQSRYPGFFDYFFVYQQFQRYASTGFNNAQPFWFFAPVLLATALPWTLWGWPLLRKAFWTDADPHGLRRFMSLWAAVVVVFFSIPVSKLAGYVMPALPPLIFLLAEALLSRVQTGFSWSSGQGRRVSASLAGAVAIGLAAVAVTLLIPSANRSNKALATSLRAQISQNDTLVILGAYPFDVPFYARYRKPAWVVGGWDDPAIERRDNWRKELYDAIRFNPARGSQTLISPQAWRQRTCAAETGERFWIWGRMNDAQNTPLLQGKAPALSGGVTGVWRIDITDTFKRDACGASSATM
jgi:4-amino-4-deoxy-L-arabinose transferase-like glycosyltransferase